MEKTEKKIQPVVRICWNCRNKVGQDYEIFPKCGRLPFVSILFRKNGK